MARAEVLFFHQARHELDKVTGLETVIELMDEDIVPRIPACTGAAGQGEQIGSTRDPGGGT